MTWQLHWDFEHTLLKHVCFSNLSFIMVVCSHFPSSLRQIIIGNTKHLELYNTMGHSESRYFWNLTNLTEIYFRSNLVSDVEDFAFVDISTVTYIDLAYTMPLMIHVWRIVTENCVWRKILKHCAWRVISKHCARRPSDARRTQLFKTLCLTLARHQPDVTFRNQVSGAKFQNHAPEVIFCDHASDVQYESGYVQQTVIDPWIHV